MPVLPCGCHSVNLQYKKKPFCTLCVKGLSPLLIKECIIEDENLLLSLFGSSRNSWVRMLPASSGDTRGQSPQGASLQHSRVTPSLLLASGILLCSLKPPQLSQCTSLNILLSHWNIFYPSPPLFPAGIALNPALPRRIFVLPCCVAQGSLGAQKKSQEPPPCAAPHSFPTGISSTKERCCRLKIRESNFIYEILTRKGTLILPVPLYPDPAPSTRGKQSSGSCRKCGKAAGDRAGNQDLKKKKLNVI